jgi:hypothetical protein
MWLVAGSAVFAGVYSYNFRLMQIDRKKKPSHNEKVGCQIESV